MWFNNVLSAKHHARYNHTDIITSCKQLNDVYEIIEKRANKSQAIDYKKQDILLNYKKYNVLHIYLALWIVLHAP